MVEGGKNYMNKKLIFFETLIAVVLGGAFVYMTYSDPNIYSVVPPKIKPTPNYLHVDLSENSLFMSKVLEICFDEPEDDDDCSNDHQFLMPAPQFIKKVTPVYPEQALKQKIGGKVAVELLINEKGMVEDTRILMSTNHIFDEPVIEAVKKCQFVPPKDAFGNSARGWHALTLKFSP